MSVIQKSKTFLKDQNVPCDVKTNHEEISKEQFKLVPTKVIIVTI